MLNVSRSTRLGLKRDCRFGDSGTEQRPRPFKDSSWLILGSVLSRVLDSFIGYLCEHLQRASLDNSRFKAVAQKQVELEAGT